MAWYSVICGGVYSGPRGPWRSVEEGEEAIRRHAKRRGAAWGTEAAIASLSVVGPYPTREVARGACPEDVMFSPGHRRSGAAEARVWR